jgi:two-component system, cell cycle sensor histidine kinase and response regulator CckA
MNSQRTASMPRCMPSASRAGRSTISAVRTQKKKRREQHRLLVYWLAQRGRLSAFHEAALVRGEDRRARIERLARFGTWEWDPVADQVFWSEGMFEIFGLDPGRPPPRFEEFDRLFPPGDQKRLRAAVEAALTRGEPYALELHTLRGDGEVRTGATRGEVEMGPDGKVVRLFGSHLDITDRKRREVELERLQRAIEQAGDAILVTDPEGTIEYVNPAFERISGFSREEALGRNPSIQKSGVQAEAFYREMWETITGGEIWQGRIVNRRKDGTEYTADASISPVRDASGEIVNFVAVHQDVTRVLDLESQLLQSQKLESIGSLAGGIAHDFNNMLTVILGRLEMALRATAAEDPRRSDLEEVRAAARRSSELVSQLLGFARKQIIAPRALDLNAAIEARLGMLRPLIGEDLDLRWLPADAPWAVHVDPSQLDQILTNLVVNARDALAGVGRITIEVRSVELDEAYCADHLGFRPGAYVMLAVSDSGQGMDRETMSRIFEPFFTTKAPGRGTGLGLSTVFGIVKQNQGFINVYSEPGEGSSFRIYLPRHGGEAAPARPATSGDGARKVSETVLLVEDEAPLLGLATLQLETLGYNVLAAGHPEEAIAVAEGYEGPIHLLMADVVLPGMNGRALYERLLTGRPDLECLYVSGYTAAGIAHRGVLDEGVHFLQKPFTVRELEAALHAALGGSSS